MEKDLARNTSNGSMYQEINSDEKFDIVDGPQLETQQCSEDVPPCSHSNIMKTVATYIAFFGRGMGISIVGATVLQLEQQTSSTTEDISAIFFWTALGSLLGNVIVILVFDRVPTELLLSCGCLAMACAMTAIPFCTSLWTLILVCVVNGFAQGILGGGHSYVMKTWILKAASFLQALHLILSVGSSVSPLIVDAFLPGKIPASVDTDFHLNNNTSSITKNLKVNTISGSQTDDMDINDSYSGYFHNMSSNTTDMASYSIDNLLYPYLLTSGCLLIASIVYILTFLVDLYTFRLNNVHRTEQILTPQIVDKGHIKNKVILGILLLYIVLYGGLELTYGSWILTFCVEHGNLSFKKATLVTSVYWISLAAGRGISIVTMKIFSSTSISCVCLVSAVAALLVETVAYGLHPVVIWVCTAVVGLSFAPLVGACMTYSQQELNTPSKLTTLFVFAMLLGFLSMPALVGFLFAKYTPMCFLYILLSSTVMSTLLFFGVVIYMAKTRNVTTIEK